MAESGLCGWPWRAMETPRCAANVRRHAVVWREYFHAKGGQLAVLYSTRDTL